MDDIAASLGRALASVEPVSVDEAVAAATRRRGRRRRARRRAGALCVAVALAAVVAGVTADRSHPGTTVEVTGPAGDAGGPTGPLYDVLHQIRFDATGELAAGGALYAWADSGGAPARLERIDPAAARVTATADLAVDGAVWAGGRLWLTVSSAAPSTSDLAPPELDGVVALDPTSLAVVHRVRIPTPPASGSGGGGIAAAGGLVWVVGDDALYAIDPARDAVVRTVAAPYPPPTGGFHVGPGEYGVDIAAPPDGSVLWSAESPGGGGYDGLQVRDPRTGAVLADAGATPALGSLGGVRIAAGDGDAWFAYATGMMGGYLQVLDRPGLPKGDWPVDTHDSNDVSVSLAAGRLWVFDPGPEEASCADPSDGRILARAPVIVDGVAPLPGGEIAVLGDGTLAIARPSVACGA